MHTNMVNLGTLIKPAKVERCKCENFPVLSMTMHEGLVFQNEKFKKTIASKDTSNYKIVRRNQLVISFPIDEGVLATQRITDEGIVSPAYGVWDVDTKKIIPLFLEMSLRCNRALDYYKSHLRGSTARRRSLPTPTLLAFTIPLPTMTEQQEILNIIDKAKSLVEFRKRQLQQLDELVKARFVELFGDYNLSHTQDNWKPIFKIGKVVGGATPKTNIDEFWNGEFRWITPAELQADTGYIYDSARKLTKAGIESCSLQEMPIDTVILSSRAPIGKVAIAGNTFYCNQGFKNIICSKEVLPRYLYTILLLNTDYLNSLGRGATFKEISKSIVENIKIPVPQLELQNEFTTFVKQIDKSKFVKIYQSKENYYDSI